MFNNTNGILVQRVIDAHELNPAVEKRVYLLKEFTSGASDAQENLDVPDPIGKPHNAYKECFSEIKEAIHKIKELI